MDVVLRENYESVLACLEMKESLDRMDSGALFIVLGHDKEARQRRAEPILSLLEFCEF